MTMRPLRILQIVPSLAPETGGPTTSVPKIGKALTSLGHRVALYTTAWPVCENRTQSLIRIEKDEGLEIFTFPAQRSSFFPNMPYSPALVKSVLEHSREFDIVHNFSLWNPVATFSLGALRRTGSLYCVSPLGMLDPVVIRRNRWKKIPWRLLWERANIEKAALIHFTTRLEEQRARDIWKLNQSIVIPHFVDLAYWRSLPAPALMERRFPQLQGREVILFVGRINWVKNLDLLLEALVQVRRERQNAMLVFVGPDNEGYQSVLEKQARKLGIDTHILFTGMLEGEELKSAYARANAAALVSQKENFGHGAAEALACGIPVVVSNEVGVSADWPACGAVFRVETGVVQIAAALIRALRRSAEVGVPDPDARNLAKRFFTNSEAIKFYTIFNTLVLERLPA
jgi:glycosyltransferase involved in cell wall biosynthesis